MTIHLPEELESSIQAVVHGGHFASIDDAMAEAARMLLRSYKHPSPSISPSNSPNPDLGSIGAMAEDAELLDEIVADAYRRRREDKPRTFDL